MAGGHSLGAWGERLNKAKGGFTDFAGGLTLEMVEYCHQDVAITAEMFVKLIKVLRKIEFSEKSIWIQHRLTVLLDRQNKNGFWFNIEEALALYQELRAKERELEEKIHAAFPPTETLVRTAKVFTRDGRRTAIYEKDVDRYRIEFIGDGSEYQAYQSIPFSVGSPKQRVEKLIELGWIAKEFTEKGTPTPFIKGKLSPSLEAFLEPTTQRSYRVLVH